MLLANFLEATGLITLVITLLLSLISFVFIIKLTKAFKKAFAMSGGFNPLKLAINKRRRTK